MFTHDYFAEDYFLEEYFPESEVEIIPPTAEGMVWTFPCSAMHYTLPATYTR